MADYQLHNIPNDLWNQFKHLAVDEKKSLRELIITAIRAYLDGRKEK